MIEVTTKEELISAITEADDYFVIDFYASWCAPCKMMAPIFESLSEDILDVTFIKCLIDDNQDFSGIDILNNVSVRSVPMFLFASKNKNAVLAQKAGTMNKNQLTNFIELSR